MLLLIDGDVLAYKSCKPRWKSSARKTGVGFVSLDDDGKKMETLYTEEEDQHYLQECWSNFPRELDMMCGRLFADDYLMAMKGPSNYRDDVYPDYKLNRRNSQPQLKAIVPRVRELAIMSGYAIEAQYREADDYLRIWANECARQEIDYAICSIDKDLLCIPGKHYLMHKDRLITVTPEEARLHYYQQILAGDPTDHIPGLPGIGMISAAKRLAGCETDEDFQEVVVSLYIEKFGDDWENMLLSNGKMVHIQEHIRDWFSIKDWPVVKDLRGI